MPSINEVWEQAQQINANLSVLHNDLTTLHNDLTVLDGGLDSLNGRADQLIQQAIETNDWLNSTRQLLDQGLAELTEALVSAQLRLDAIIETLQHHTEQHATMICNLENISRNTCDLVSFAARDEPRQVSIEASLRQLTHMFATTAPEAALAWARAEEERLRDEACCPPDEPEPACVYAPCEAPEKAPEPKLPSPGPIHKPGEPKVDRASGKPR